MKNTFSLPNRRFAPVIWIVLALLLAAQACNLLQPTPTETPAPSPTVALPTSTPRADLPPALVEAAPAPGVELALDGALTLYFSQPMQRASVEAAFRGQAGGSAEALAGRFDWVDDATVRFTPDGAFTPGNEVTIEIATSAQSSSGKSLLAPVSLNYQTVGMLQLTQSLPAPGAFEVSPLSAVVASFNRPVVALGAEQSGLPAAFSLEPATSGRGEWVNTSTYIFYPDLALAGGTQYTVRLDPALTGVGGAPLDTSTLEWQFETDLPHLTGVAPSTEQPIPLDAAFRLKFNQPMDTASTQGAFSLNGPAGAVDGQFGWENNFSTLVFTPTAQLQRDSEYALDLSSAARSAGGAPLVEGFSALIYTYPELFFWNTTPQPGGTLSNFGQIGFETSVPLNPFDLEKYLAFDPPAGEIVAYYSDYNSSLYVYGEFVPETDYTLTVSADLPDKWGGTLGEPFTLNFRTAPLQPQLMIGSGYTSNALFITGSDTGLPAQATNLDSVTLRYGSLPLTDFISLLAPGNYDGLRNYVPAQSQENFVPLALLPNQSENITLDFNSLGQPLAPGLYHLRLQAGVDYPPGPFLLVVSNVHVVFKLSATDALVWALDLRSGQPVADAPVTLFNEFGEVITSGRTNGEGVLRTAIPTQKESYDTRYAVLGDPGDEHFGMALSSWSNGISGWDYGMPVDQRPPRPKIYLYTDRPIYQPGQTVYFRAVLRQVYNGRYSASGLDNLTLVLNGEQGQEIQRQNFPVSEYGSIAGAFELPADAAPGYYNLWTSPELDYQGVGFQVANYRKPEIDLQVTFDVEDALAETNLNATVETRYFFGAPAGGLVISYSLYTNQAYFELPGYQVGNIDDTWIYPPDWYYGYNQYELVESGVAQTDAQGLLNLTLPIRAETDTSRYMLEVTTREEIGLWVSNRAEVLVHPAAHYVGIRPAQWVARAAEPAAFDFSAVNWLRQPQPGLELSVRLEQVTWERQPTESEYDLPEYTRNLTLVEERQVTTNAQGEASTTLTPPEAGTYMATVTSGGASTQVLIWVGGAGQAVWPNLPNSRLAITADRQTYAPGDTAEIFIPNPLGETAWALVSLERGVVLDYQLVPVEPNGLAVSLPLAAEHAPNVYVSVSLIGSQGFRYGLLNLEVTPVAQTLNVRLLNEPEMAGPGEAVTLQLEVTDASGAPVQGEFSLAVVDLAVLALAEPNAVDIVSAFYSQQPLGVQTGVAWAAHTGRDITEPGGRGGGGGGDGSVPELRSDFEDTALWLPAVVTDAQGRAEVTFNLPDNLTTWQVQARGLTQDTLVGEAASQLVASKPLLIRPSTPRFLVVGDHVRLAAMVNNNTGAAQQVQVNLQASGVSLDDPALATQTINLPDGGRQLVTWWGRVQDAAQADLIFAVQGGGYNDASTPVWGALPITRYVAEQSFGTAGLLISGETRLEVVSLPRSFDPQGGSLEIEMAPSLAAALLPALETLEHSRCECTELTLSTLLANVEAFAAVQSFGLDAPELRANLEAALATGLEKLLAAQRGDGGWGWWSGSSASDVYVSTYVLHGLTRLQANGISIPPQALTRLTSYLAGNLPNVSFDMETWQLDRLAFQLFAMIEADQPVVRRAEELYELRDRLSPWAQAYLLLSLPADSDLARTLLSDLQAKAERAATGVFWGKGDPGYQNMSSGLFSTAISVLALAQRDPAAALLPEAVRYLAQNRTASGGWHSTYETAWIIQALSEYMKGTGELGGSFAFSANLNGSPVLQGSASNETRLNPVVTSLPLSQLDPGGSNLLELLRAAGEGRLYYNLHLNVLQPVAEVAALNRGMSITRSYARYLGAQQDPQPLIDGQAGIVGGTIQVRLNLTVPEDAYYLVIEDPIPAGSEIVDQALLTTRIDLEGPLVELYDPADPYRGGWGWWLFNTPQIYNDRMVWSADYLPAGSYQLTYLISLTQAGEYQVIPARASLLYFPEIQGLSSGELLEIGE